MGECSSLLNDPTLDFSPLFCLTCTINNGRNTAMRLYRRRHQHKKVPREGWQAEAGRGLH